VSFETAGIGQIAGCIFAGVVGRESYDI